MKYSQALPMVTSNLKQYLYDVQLVVTTVKILMKCLMDANTKAERGIKLYGFGSRVVEERLSYSEYCYSIVEPCIQRLIVLGIRLEDVKL